MRKAKPRRRWGWQCVLRGMSMMTVCHCQTVHAFWKDMTQEQKQQAAAEDSRFLEDVLTLADDITEMKKHKHPYDSGIGCPQGY